MRARTDVKTGPGTVAATGMNEAAPVESVRVYLLVWAALLLLLALSLGSAYIHLGPFNVIANVGIAVIKAGLVMVFFMHLRARGGILRLVAAAGFFWLLILLGLSLIDPLTRVVPQAPW